jgi:hypothetical protein
VNHTQTAISVVKKRKVNGCSTRATAARRFMQNTETNPNQTPDTPKCDDVPARARRRFDEKSISTIARLVARSLTESEAARLLGYEPRAWFNFKARGRNDERFCALLEKFRAARVDSLVARIEKSANGVDLKQPDWRAASQLLSHVDPRRFSDSGMRASIEISVPTAPVVDEAALDKVLQLMLSLRAAKQAQAVEIAASVEPKQLPDAKPKNA